MRTFLQDFWNGNRKEKIMLVGREREASMNLVCINVSSVYGRERKSGGEKGGGNIESY